MRLTRVEPESTSPIFMLKFLIIWLLLEGVKDVIHQSLVLFTRLNVDLLLVDLFLVEIISD